MSSIPPVASSPVAAAATSAGSHASAPTAPAAPAASSTKSDSATFSPQAQALLSGDRDHDGDNH
jgi:hypothetical protein